MGFCGCLTRASRSGDASAVPSTEASAEASWEAVVIRLSDAEVCRVRAAAQMRSRAGETPGATELIGAISPPTTGAAGRPQASPPGQRRTSIAYNRLASPRTSAASRSLHFTDEFGWKPASIPKPTSFTAPRVVITTLSGISCSWNSPWPCSEVRASASSRTTQAASRALSGPCFSRLVRDLPCAYSQTM